MKYPVSNATKRYLERIGENCIGYGFCGWLDEIYDGIANCERMVSQLYAKGDKS